MDHAFEGCTSLVRIDIPNSVKEIGWGAFRGCASLQSIDIPNSVTSIGANAFRYCTSLQSIDIPNSVTSIRKSTFFGCSSLVSIDIPNSVTSIGRGAFIGCTSLQSIDIPNSVTSIGTGAFSGCTSLQSVDIPNSVTNIGDGAFSGCTSLQSIDIPNSVTSIEEDAYAGCTSLESIDIPNGVSIINKRTFEGCSSLRSIDLPDSIISIGPYAFYESGLEKVFIPCSVKNIGEQAFSGAPIDEFVVAENNNSFFSFDGVLFDEKIDWIKLRRISISANDRFYRLFNYPPARKSSKYIVTNETIVLCSCAFKGASYLEGIILHDNVYAFEGEQTFRDCTSLKEIRLPSGLERLPISCFEGCESLEHVYLPDKKKLKIEKGSFKRCPSLIGLHSRMETPENIDISEDAFEEDTFNLCTLYIPSGTRWAYRHHPMLGKFKNIEIEKEQKSGKIL